jgi:hypothetical protein
VTNADEMKLCDELIAADEAGDDSRWNELWEQLDRTASGRALRDARLRFALDSALDARGDMPEPGSKKAREQKN